MYLNKRKIQEITSRCVSIDEIFQSLESAQAASSYFRGLMVVALESEAADILNFNSTTAWQCNPALINRKDAATLLYELAKTESAVDLALIAMRLVQLVDMVESFKQRYWMTPSELSEFFTEDNNSLKDDGIPF